METETIPHAGHDEHLCYLANMGFLAENPHEYRLLIEKPKYICQQCGRAANNAENLCKPKKI